MTPLRQTPLGRTARQALNRSAFVSLGKFVAVLAGLLMVGLTFRHVDFARAVGLLTEAGPSMLLILVPFGIAMTLDTWAWRGLFENLARSLRFGPLFAVRASSEAMLMSLSGGAFLSEGIAPLVLKRRFQVPISETLATTGVRRVLITAAQSVYLGAGVVLGFSFLQGTSRTLVGGDSLSWLLLALASVLFLASVVILTLLVRGGLVSRLHSVLSKVLRGRAGRWLNRIEHAASATDRHFRAAIHRPSSAVRPIALFLIAWICEAAETFLILRLLNLEVSFLTVWAFEPLVSLLRHAAFFVPAGIGVQEAGYLIFLRSLGVGDPVSVGAAFALAKRAKEACFVLLGFGLLAVMSARDPAESVEAA